MGPNGEFKKFMQALGDVPTAQTALSHHLADDTLVAFYQDRLPAAERESADWHLKQCTICASKFEDARDFFEPRYIGEKDWTEFEQRQAWRELRAKLPFDTKRVVNPPLRRSTFFNSRAMLALAAGLLLTTSLTGVIAFRLYQEKQALQVLLDQKSGGMVAKMSTGATPLPSSLPALPAEARLSPTIREITVYDTTRSEENGKDVLNTRLPAKAESFTFTLDLVSDAFATYRVEFTDLAGKLVLTQPNLRPNERASEKSNEPRPNQNATLSVTIPRRLLKAGQYHFQIYGQRDGQPVLLESLIWSFN
jgi:hypothetical protein